MFVRNSGAGNGCANFMGASKKCVLSAGKKHVHKIPPFRGGGVFGFFFWGGGGWECRFYFYGRADFSDKGSGQDNSHEPGGSNAVRELSREPAMF